MTTKFLNCLNLAKWLLTFVLVKPIWHSLFYHQVFECNIMTPRLHTIWYSVDRKNMIVKILVDQQCKLHHDYTVNATLKIWKNVGIFLVLTKSMS